MNAKASTVFVVDDDKAVRKGLRILMKSVGLAVETFASAREFLDAYDPDRPGCLVLDVRMPGMSGLELQARLAEQAIEIPIIFLSAHGDVPMAVRAVKMGALDFIEKPFRHQVLLDLIQQAIEKDAQDRREREKQQSVHMRLELLTERERQVLDLVVAGEPNKAIADDLGISEKTVEFHRSNVMKKMGVYSLPDLVRAVLSDPPTQGNPEV